MSIKSFLQDLNQAFQEKEEEKRKRDELAQQRDKERKAFYELYSNSYNNGIVKKIKKLEKEMKEDFKVRYKEAPTKSSSNSLEGNIMFQPKFVSEVYEVRVAVRGNYKEKTLSVTGIATYRLSAKHKAPIEVFNDDIQLFDPEQTEDYITTILRYFFIKE
ncbi:hypothetical protein [Pontibacter akesuensis]|uniref:Uncharacterized protein n=1 Tax=Pontibacter akesuensis TaxID=388950 RepID=A0A1I7HYD2_9BACT|nr:hypothetical protein [Pontibacter akesuensis]GHA64229.1 hypothetical protein GCM10007389_16110 [Pontibacter akesuensis]SFU65715.1 hypothetical protein SAMN04487941_1772 [Pontibacter akesuensis]